VCWWTGSSLTCYNSLKRSEEEAYTSEMNKLTKWAVALGGVGSFVVAKVAGATSLFNVPTSTVPSLTANISDTIAGEGLLLVIVAVIALPVVFWLIGRVKALFPKSK